MNKQGRFLDSLTARQYGEVVIPDPAPTEQSEPRVQHRAESWYPAPAGPQICHVFDPDRPEGASWGTGLLLRADERFARRSGAKLGVRVQLPLHICLECRSKSKNRDNCVSRSFSVG